MAIPVIPETIQHKVFVYLNLEHPEAPPSVFNWRVNEDSSWLFLFEHEVTIPVPASVNSELPARLPEHFRAAESKVRVEAEQKLAVLRDIEQKFLALEG